MFAFSHSSKKKSFFLLLLSGGLPIWSMFCVSSLITYIKLYSGIFLGLIWGQTHFYANFMFF